MRPTDAANRNGVLISKSCGGRLKAREISSSAFSDTIFSLFGWNTDYKYRMTGDLCESDGALAYIFNADDSEAFLKPYILLKKDSDDEGGTVQPVTQYGKRVRVIPEQWIGSFGKDFYPHEQPLSALASAKIFCEHG